MFKDNYFGPIPKRPLDWFWLGLALQLLSIPLLYLGTGQWSGIPMALSTLSFATFWWIISRRLGRMVSWSLWLMATALNVMIIWSFVPCGTSYLPKLFEAVGVAVVFAMAIVHCIAVGHGLRIWIRDHPDLERPTQEL